MKAHDILRRIDSLLAGVLHRVDGTDSTLRAVADTAADISDGIVPQAGIEPQAAHAIAMTLIPERDALGSARVALGALRYHVAQLASSLPDQAFLDWLADPSGGAVVIDDGATVFVEHGA